MNRITVRLAETTPGHYFDEMTEFLTTEIGNVLPGYEIDLQEPKTEELPELLAMLPEADALVIGGAGQRRPVSEEVIAAGPKLRFVMKLGTRYHQVDVDAITKREMPLAVEPAPSHMGVAEHALCLLLALSKGLFEAHRRVTSGYYRTLGLEPKPTTPTQYVYNWTEIEGITPLWGKTLGIIGLGDTGAETAKRAKAFGLRTLYYTRHRPSPEEAAEYGVTYAPLDQLLRESDFVSLHASHTPETENMMSAAQFKLMKPTALLINTARGGLVDEKALYDALTLGEIAGAALDVWKQEPTPADNPLLKLPNVITSPHIAVGSLPIPGRFRGVLRNIVHMVKGEPLEFVVNGIEVALER